MILGVFSPQYLLADSSNDKGENSHLFFEKKTVKIKTRPKAPSRQVVSATFADGYLTIFFAIPEGEYELTVTDCENVQTSFSGLDSSALCQVHVGNLESATFEITTSNGNTYTAEYPNL